MVCKQNKILPALHTKARKIMKFKNHLSVLFVRVSLSIYHCCLHTTLFILLAKSCIPSILIDPESMEFSTIERYQISEFGSIIIYMIYQDIPQGLMLLVGQNDLQ